MDELLDEIEDGRFAKGFLEAQASGGSELREAIDAEAAHPIVATGRGLREFLERCQLGGDEPHA